MKNILIIGEDISPLLINDQNKAIAFKQLGFEVTLHMLVDDLDKHSETVEHLNHMNIKTLLDDIKAINWERLDKEIKIHSIIIINPLSELEIAMDIAKKYGKDVWCLYGDNTVELNVEKSFQLTIDNLFVKLPKGISFADHESIDLLKNKKIVVRIDSAGQICSSVFNGVRKDFDLIRFKEQFTNLDFEMFFVGFIYGYFKGNYMLECMMYANATAFIFDNGINAINEKINPASIERFLEENFQR